ncbi:MAG: carbohydrate kinase family protein [Desulfonatronovibrionaceae bacterium]
MKKIIVFGEVLFDFFPDGRKVIGGAPFNLTCHLRGMGLDPVFVSRIGDDDPGREVVRVMDSWSISAAGLQRDDSRITGLVRVKIEDDEPSYEIKNNVAYDFIENPPAEVVQSQGLKLLYHGTLAARNPVSASTLYQLCSMEKTQVFCDINLRDPWWSKELIMDILGWSAYLKVNLDELHRISAMTGLVRGREWQEMAAALQEKFQFKCLIVTLGTKGAALFPRDGEWLHLPAPRAEDFKDSVGAGDAFSAVVILGITRGWDWKGILKNAVSFAAQICSNQGAVPKNREIYEQFS